MTPPQCKEESTSLKIVRRFFLNGESYGNAVPADEEDLTSVNGALQLKDREVNADNF